MMSFSAHARRSQSGGAGWLALVGVVVVLAVLALIVFGWYVSGYNKAVRLEQDVKNAWGNVDADLTRRMDLVPNLVNSVKGYAAHEQAIFDKITSARESYRAAQSVGQKAAAASIFDRALADVLSVAESNPEIKANENFLKLQDQLEGTENRIAVARTRYNAAVNMLNSYCRSFFGSFFCKKAGVGMAEYYEAPAEKREAPKVEF